MFTSCEMFKRLRRIFCLGLLVMLAPLTLSGCFGHFPMTRAVYNGNRNVYGSVEGDNTQRKMAQSAVMWVFIPVYAVAGIGDMVVFNLIEFWTGSKTDLAVNYEANGTKVALVSTKDGREAVLTVSRDSKILIEQHGVKVSDAVFELRDASGALTGKILKTQAGGIELTDGQGRIIQTLSAEDLATLPRN